MHFLFALKTYEDTDAVLDVRQLALLARKHGHHVTLLTFESSPPPSCNHAVKILTCAKGFLPWSRHRLFQRAFDQAMASGGYDMSLSFVPIKGADFYLPRRFAASSSLLDFFRHPPTLLWQICHTQFYSYFTYVTNRQRNTLQVKGCVPRARLLQIGPEFHAECIPLHDAQSQNQFRKALSFSSKHIVVLQVADDWHRQGVDRSLAALGALNPSLSTVCRYVLISQESSQRKLEKLAEKQGFSPNRVLNLGKQYTISQLLTISDLILHPAREEEAGTMLTDALTAGVPVVCTDNCGYSIFLHKTCCPVIPAPYHLAAITDAISFAIVHLPTFKKLIPKEFSHLDLQNRSAQLLHALESYPRIAVRQLSTAELREIVAIHHKNLISKKTLKNERKRTASRVVHQGIHYLVKEFRPREWWHFTSCANRTERGTALLARYTPQVCGKYHDRTNGSDYLVFHDCGDGNFFQAEYARRPDALQLYSACGRLLAELHDANIHHHDTKPANFVLNERCRGECALEVCLVDCDNVTRSPIPLTAQTRAHSLAQFIAGTGKIARLDPTLWRQLVNAFCDGYSANAQMPVGDLDQLWQRVWHIIDTHQHIEYTLPDIALDESTQLNVNDK